MKTINKKMLFLIKKSAHLKSLVRELEDFHPIYSLKYKMNSIEALDKTL